MSVEVEFDPEAVSITPCRTHSPKEHPFNERPAGPNTELIVACLKEQVAEPFEAGGLHAILTVPLNGSIVLVRLVVGTPPQNVVFGIQVHFRFW